MTRTQRKLVAAFTLVLATPLVQAHMVWLERDGNTAAHPARIYFGEFAENVREQTGGALDRLVAPVAFVGSSDNALPFVRNADHLEVRGADGEMRVIHAVAPREDKKNGGHSRTVFLGRAGRIATTAALDLELVPVSAGGDRFTLLFKRKPLPKTELTLIGPPRWQKPLRTDEQGQVQIETPWQGRYLIETTYTEELAGELNGAKFDRSRYVFTLTFTQADGIKWATP